MDATVIIIVAASATSSLILVAVSVEHDTVDVVVITFATDIIATPTLIYSLLPLTSYRFLRLIWKKTMLESDPRNIFNIPNIIIFLENVHIIDYTKCL